MRMTSILVGLFAILTIVAHFAWTLTLGGASPIQNLLGDYGVTALKVALCAASVTVGSYIFSHALMWLMHGRTRRQNKEWPPETYVSYDECGSHEGDSRDDRAMMTAVLGMILGVLLVCAIYFGGTAAFFYAVLATAWLLIAAPLRLKLAPGKPKEAS